MRNFKKVPEMALNNLENLNEGVYYTKKYNNWMNQLCEKKLSIDDIAQVLEFERSLQQNASEKNVPLNIEATDFYVDRFIDILVEKRNQVNNAKNKKKELMIRLPRKPGFARKAIKKITTINNANKPSPLPVIKPKRKKAKRKCYRKKKNGVNKAVGRNIIIPKVEAREQKKIKKKKQPKKRKPVQRKKPAKQRRAIKKIMPMIHCPPLPKDNHSLTDLIDYAKSTPERKKPNKKNKRKVVDKKQQQGKQENKVKAIRNRKGKDELNNFFLAKKKPPKPKGVGYRKKKRNAKKNKRNIYKKKKNGFDRKKIQKIFTNQDKCSLSTQPSTMTPKDDYLSDVEMMDWQMDTEDSDYIPYRTPQNKKKKYSYGRPAQKRGVKKKQK